MRNLQFNHTQIANILKDFEYGKTTDEINRQYESIIMRMVEENARLKRMYINLTMELDTAKHTIEKKL